MNNLDYQVPPSRKPGTRLALVALLCSSVAASVIVAMIVVDFTVESMLAPHTERLLLPTALVVLLAFAGVLLGIVARSGSDENERSPRRRWSGIAIIIGFAATALGSLLLLGMWVLLHSE